MGASHSQPRPRSQPNSRPSSSPQATATTSSLPSRRSRFSSLNRLPSFARRGEDGAKRGRSTVGSPPNTDPKRRRLRVPDDNSSAESGLPTPISTVESSAGPSSTPEDIPTPSSTPAPIADETVSSLQSSHETLPFSNPLPSPSEDPLHLERVRSISTIREALGPEWPSPTSVNPGIDRVVNRLRGRDNSPTPPINGPLSDSASEFRRTVSSRLSTWLGLAPPRTPAEPAGPDGNQRPNPEVTSQDIAELYRQLEAATEEFAETGRQMEELRQTLAEQERAREQLMAEEARRRLAEGPLRAVPAGSVLVIQGLAQTQATTDEALDDSREVGLEEDLSEVPIQDESRGSIGRRRRSRRSSSADNGASLDDQARMIGGLLTVAAAATATTLLAPASTTRRTRNTPSSTLEAVMNRFRPSRLTRPNQSVEEALGEYLRTVLRDNRRIEQGAEGQSTTDHEAIMSSEFQTFLEGLQSDLVDAVREFAGPVVRETQQGNDGSEDQARTPDDSRANEGEISTSANGLDSTPSLDQFATAPSSPILGATTPPVETVTSPIPRFHTQIGQNLGGASRSSGVTGGEGQPRRLNFFRAHLFPAMRNADSENPSDQDPNAIVPSIFIGVRSLRHDPSMTTDALVQHPAFPFHDGVVPSTTTTEPDSPSTPPTPSIPLSPSTEPRRTLRDRVLDRFSLSNRRNQEQSPPLQGPLNTYLVYVIGGNYPRNHPILAIPHLVTGGPLTDEEMTMIAELMGTVKPPTVSVDDIEKSGLKVVKGEEMKGLGNEGGVLANSVEACSICLSEYEPQDECRVLHCRHAFHKECVDHWLSQGRNSCPACRSEAVVGTSSTSVNPVQPSTEDTALSTSGSAGVQHESATQNDQVSGEIEVMETVVAVERAE